MRKARREMGSTLTGFRWPAFLALGVLAAMAFALSACGGTSNNSGEAAASAGSQAASTVENVSLVIKSDEEKGKKGSDGNWHDAFLPADFSVKAGTTVRVTVTNYDDMAHTFTAADLGTNAEIAAGGEDKPSTTTFTFHAPDKAGSYAWFCAIPCDPWAMAHDGFMKGHVTVT